MHCGGDPRIWGGSLSRQVEVINEVSEWEAKSATKAVSVRLRGRCLADWFEWCDEESEKSEAYARLHVGLGISPLHQWWTGHRLLWPDQGDERAGDRDP